MPLNLWRWLSFFKKRVALSEPRRYFRGLVFRKIFCRDCQLLEDSEMTLISRKVIIISLIGAVFLFGNILVVANWIAETGIGEKAQWVRREFLTGTAIAIILTLLILLTGSKRSDGSRAFGLIRKCPVCDHRLIGRGSYCSLCGSKV